MPSLANRIFCRCMDAPVSTSSGNVSSAEVNHVVRKMSNRLGASGLLAVEGAGQGLEAGLDPGGAPAGQPVNEEAAQGGEDHLGDLELALTGPLRRADRQQRRQVLLRCPPAELGVTNRV